MSNNMDFHIAISGRSGCGNTTVSKTLAKMLNMNVINYTFRNIAIEEGISFEEVRKRAQEMEKYDRRVDKVQLELARKKPAVLGSRLAIWLLTEAKLKVFLYASLEVRAKRIKDREGGKLKDIVNITAERDLRDHDRYLKLYGINNNDYSFADLIINTERFEVYQVVNIIETAAKSIFMKRNNK